MKLELKTLIDTLDEVCTNYIEAAAYHTIERRGSEILIEDLLSIMLDRPNSILNRLLEHYRIEGQNLQQILEQNSLLSESESTNPIFSKALIGWIEESFLETKVAFNLEKISEITLFYTLFKNGVQYSNTAYFKLFSNIEAEKVLALLKGLSEDEKREQSSHSSVTKSTATSRSDLEKYTVNLTQLAKEHKIDPVLSRDDEIKQAIDILSRRRKNNPIFVGEAGVGKTAVVEGLALKIIEKDVPEHLYDAQILSLDLGAMQSGASVKGEFERRLQSVINAIRSSTQFTILFIDEAHTLIGAGGKEGGGDAANLLKPFLARGELKTIAATTWMEYRKYFEKDPALARRFQKVDLLEPSIESCITILRGVATKYEEMHHVYIEDDALVAAASLSARYIIGRQLPDKAIDVLDTACANVKINASNRPFAIQHLENKRLILKRKYEALQRDHDELIKDNGEILEELTQSITKLEEEIAQETEIWSTQKELLKQIKELKKSGQKEALLEAYQQFKIQQKEKAYIHEFVSKDQVAEVISSWTGIPLGSMKQKQVESVVDLAHNMKEKIIGQDEAIDYLSQFLQIAISGLKKENTPEGVFLLVGPSGVGKTETALSIADLMFGGSSFITTINMSEFQEKHTVSRLIGSPPGYVGYGEGGQLTDPVRVKPYSVVLLDEIEKAHPDILNLFYQIFDKGLAYDGEGREINFKNTVIIMTSNLGTDEITQLCVEQNNPSQEKIVQTITPLLSHYLKPALLGRMIVIPYKNLSHEALSEITKLKLNAIKKQLEAKRIELHVDDTLIDHIVSLSDATDTGARNLELIINNNLMPKLSKMVLQSTLDNQQLRSIDISIDDSGEISIETVTNEVA